MKLGVGIRSAGTYSAWLKQHIGFHVPTHFSVCRFWPPVLCRGPQVSRVSVVSVVSNGSIIEGAITVTAVSAEETREMHVLPGAMVFEAT